MFTECLCFGVTTEQAGFACSCDLAMRRGPPSRITRGKPPLPSSDHISRLLTQGPQSDIQRCQRCRAKGNPWTKICLEMVRRNETPLLSSSTEHGPVSGSFPVCIVGSIIVRCDFERRVTQSTLRCLSMAGMVS